MGCVYTPEDETVNRMLSVLACTGSGVDGPTYAAVSFMVLFSTSVPSTMFDKYKETVSFTDSRCDAAMRSVILTACSRLCGENERSDCKNHPTSGTTSTDLFSTTPDAAVVENVILDSLALKPLTGRKIPLCDGIWRLTFSRGIKSLSIFMTRMFQRVFQCANVITPRGSDTIGKHSESDPVKPGRWTDNSSPTARFI
jgi:hypothetical protein